jgi:hypothetical protein
MRRRMTRVDLAAAEVLRVALDLARSEEALEDARDALISRVAGDDNLLNGALRLVPEPPLTYDIDGARRLLIAAIRRAPVEPVPRQFADLYATERYLEALDLSDAIAQLEKLEPRLGDVIAMAKQASRNRDRRLRTLRELLRRTRELVGPSAASSNPLLRSPVAGNLVTKFVAQSIPLERSGQPLD